MSLLGDALECPICHQVVPRAQYAGPQDIEPAAAAYLQRLYPAWRPEMGVCHEDLQRALNAVLAEQLANDDQGLPTPIPVYGILPVGVRLGYTKRYPGDGITIAFLDSGFSNHPDLEGRIKLYVDASSRAVRVLDTVENSGVLSWHGTMTSVVACGDGQLSDGLYRGLASAAEVVLIRVSDKNGAVNENGIWRGLDWLLANAQRYDIKLVNISLGGDRPATYASNPVDLKVAELISRGIAVVCASGNAGERRLVPPASAPGAITVGGLDDKNTLDRATRELWHSNYGQTNTGVWKPELIAPSLLLAAPVLKGSGVDEEAQVLGKLLAAQPAELVKLVQDKELIKPLINLPENLSILSEVEIRRLLRERWYSQKLISPHYQHVDGTSFAAPIVTSTAAQMLQANPTLNPAGLKDLLMRTARYLPEVKPDQQGHGIVDPWAAVSAALATRE